MTAANKTGNEYQDLMGELFDKAPKAVLGALVVSLATRLGTELTQEAINALIVEEWTALHEAGIVPQKAPKSI